MRCVIFFSRHSQWFGSQFDLLTIFEGVVDFVQHYFGFELFLRNLSLTHCPNGSGWVHSSWPTPSTLEPLALDGPRTHFFVPDRMSLTAEFQLIIAFRNAKHGILSTDQEGHVSLLEGPCKATGGFLVKVSPLKFLMHCFDSKQLRYFSLSACALLFSLRAKQL